jgi:hypothetical protein
MPRKTVESYAAKAPIGAAFQTIGADKTLRPSESRDSLGSGNRSSHVAVYGKQVPGSPIRAPFGTPPWSSPAADQFLIISSPQTDEGNWEDKLDTVQQCINAKAIKSTPTLRWAW